MPVKRRMGKLRTGEVSELAWALLTDDGPASFDEVKGQPDAWNHFCAPDEEQLGRLGRPSLESMWTAHSDEILQDWIATRPGTRPSCWWRWSAPRWTALPMLCEPREVVAGRGEPSFDLQRCYQHDPRALLAIGIPTRWPFYDETDPPRCESQAAYLDRHNLLSAKEAARLTAADFVPVVARKLMDEPCQ